MTREPGTRRLSRGGSRLLALCGAVLLASCSPDEASAIKPEASPLEKVYDEARREGIPSDATVVGSGFFIAPRMVLTSAHVLAGCSMILVENRLLGPVAVQRRAVLAQNDAAFLATDAASGEVLAVAEEPEQGALAILGFPAQAAGQGEPVRYPAANARFTGNGLLLLDAGPPAGVSGGPVVDSRGRAVALVTGRMSGAGHRVVASPLAAFPEALARYREGVSGARGASDPAGAKAATVKVYCK